MALEKLAKTPALLRKIGQVGDTRPFYSPVDKAISEITQNKATGEQMLAALLKTKGVAKELKDRPAIKKALEQPKITKQELERVAAEHPPAQIEESRSSGTFNQLEPTLPNDGSLELVKDPPTYSGNKYPYGVRDTKTGDIIGYGWDKGDAILDVYSGYPQYWGKHAQYEQYTIPGGENYREILLKLPSRRPSLKNMSRDEYNKAIEKADLEGVEDYRTSHFEGEPNILAHARVSDRTGPNGEKILHVEEIQSDWHQAGRKEGYKQGLTPEQKQEMQALLQKHADEDGLLWNDDNRLTELIELENKGVPDAPFKQNWHELVMKRLLDDAARNGYDKVVITPGAEQAKRYALSNVIDEINVVGRTHALTGEQTKQVALDTIDGRSLRLGVANDGTIDNVSDNTIEGFLGKKLDEVVGKDVAKNIMEGGSQTISGEGLQVGGEGMKGFYDQILPSFLNNYGKPYGSRVGEYTMPEVAIPLHSFDITPQMREDIIGKGLPLYQVAPVGIGAGAAMQGEQPEGYGAGGVVKKAAKAVSALKGQQAILPAAESSANLKRFLADSVVKDRMYHGTSSREKSGEALRTLSNEEAPYRGGLETFLTTNPKFASRYAEDEGGYVLPVYAQIKNPFDYRQQQAHFDARDFWRNNGGIDQFDAEKIQIGLGLKPDGNLTEEQFVRAVKKGNWPALEAPEFVEWLIDLGHDAIVTKEGNAINYGIVDPRKIKSAIGNRGTYDINESDITKADGGSVSKDAMFMAVMNKKLKGKKNA